MVLLWTILQYINLEYVVTNRRVIEVSGVLNKRTTDSSLEKINDAVLTQSIFGRIFGFGDLDILTASESGIRTSACSFSPSGSSAPCSMPSMRYERDIEEAAMPGPPLRSGR